MEDPLLALRERRELRNALIMYQALLVVGVLIVALVLRPWIETWQPAASNRAEDNYLTLIVFLAIAVPVFMFVMVFGFYNLFFFRHRLRRRPDRDGPYIVAGRGTQIAWIGITAFHALVLFAWGVIFLARADAAPPPGTNVLNIDVTANQWLFNYTYPQYKNGQSEILELPVHRPVFFTITSLDVVHSFSVNELGFKEDAVPGVFTHIRVTPEQTGDFTVRCYELCGIYHTYMEAPCRVVSAATFTAWVNALKIHGYPWGVNGAGQPNGAPPPPPSPSAGGSSDVPSAQRWAGQAALG